MPMRIPGPCSYPGCRRRATKAGRCDTHPRPFVRPKDGERPDATERGYDAGWRLLRRRYLAEYPICSEPGCDEVATHVDHWVSRVRMVEAGMDPDDWSNLRGYCRRHHTIKTNTYDGGLGNPRKPVPNLTRG